jgi:hypothetical protein
MSCGGNVRRYARRPGVEALSCFRLGSTASVLRCPRYVRLASNFGRLDVSVKSTLRATTGREQMQRLHGPTRLFNTSSA